MLKVRPQKLRRGVHNYIFISTFKTLTASEINITPKINNLPFQGN